METPALTALEPFVSPRSFIILDAIVCKSNELFYKFTDNIYISNGRQ